MNRRRLGLVLGINQTLSWGMTFYLPAVIVVPASHDLHQSTFALLGAFTMALLIAGTCAQVSQLSTVVGRCHNPRWAGKGGRLRGWPFLPSIDSSIPLSSPQI